MKSCCLCLAAPQIRLRNSSAICFDALWWLLQIWYFFRGNTDNTIHVQLPLWRLTNAQCQKLLKMFIIVCVTPLGTAKSLTLQCFWLILWMCDPASTGDSWSQLHALYPCELHSPKDVLTWSDDSAMTLRGCLDCPNWNKFFFFLKPCSDIDDLRDVVSSWVSLYTDTSIPNNTVKVFPNDPRSLNLLLNEKKKGPQGW